MESVTIPPRLINDVLVAAHTAFYRYVLESDNPLDDIAPGPVNYRPNIVTETFWQRY